MEMKGHVKQDTTLAKDEAALVTDNKGEISLLLPQLDKDDVVDGAVAFLTAVTMRYYADPEWVMELGDWFHRQLKGDTIQ